VLKREHHSEDELTSVDNGPAQMAIMMLSMVIEGKWPL
jgi:hypothetical protein